MTSEKLLMKTLNILAPLLLLFPISVFASPISDPSSNPSTQIWSVQVWDYSQLTPSDYVQIKESGANTVELQLFWSDIEPQPGKFDFTLLRHNVEWAEEAGLNFILIFWYGPFQPTWVQGYELNSSLEPVGTPGMFAPPWWAYLTDYIEYVNTTISLFLGDPHFLGAYVNYGWLDAFWFGGGYSNSSISHLRAYLEMEYNGSIEALNKAWGSSFSSFSQIRPPFQGKAWIDFEDYRIWALNYTLNSIYSSIYPELESHGRRLFIYWGGDLSNSYDLVNFPDVVMGIAARYNATVNVDDVNNPAVWKILTDLAEAYGVRVVGEWTPPPSPIYDQPLFTFSLSHYLGSLPVEEGYDYFAYPVQWETTGTAPLFSWLVNATSLLTNSSLFNLSYPEPRVAFLFSFSAEISRPSLGGEEEDALYQAIFTRIPFQVVTDYELQEGLVNLSRFRFLVLIPGILHYLPQPIRAEVKGWENEGGVIVDSPEQLPRELSYALLSYPNGSLIPPGVTLGHIEVNALRSSRGEALIVILVSPFSNSGRLGKLPDQIQFSLNLSVIGLNPECNYYTINVSDLKELTGTLSPDNSLFNFTLDFTTSLKAGSASLYLIQLKPMNSSFTRTCTLVANSTTTGITSVFRTTHTLNKELDITLILALTILLIVALTIRLVVRPDFLPAGGGSPHRFGTTSLRGRRGGRRPPPV